MSGEHASRRLIDDYARGDATMAADTLWALEAHLETCAPCRSLLAGSVSTGAPDIAALLDTVRAGLEPQLDAAVRASSLRRRPRWLSAWMTPVMAPWLAMTGVVTLTALPGLLLGGWLTGTMTAAQWLLPSLAFTATALALGSVVGVSRAATGLAAAWGVVGVVPAWAVGHVPLALQLLLQPDRLPVWGLLLALGTAGVIARRNAYSTL
ncbi:zf-HC2 domain-containing protein [Kitasatospora sp. NPDC056138]|uniref:zf-HC2 domain-containing protein n=1 Tax=Kitasatospora sp. NPDC056138 TaxID=3345724 RepID=UPI0035D7DF89